MEKGVARIGCSLVRVEAVDGRKLGGAPAGYDERSFWRRHGRSTNLREVGCYLSHVEACRMFLATGEDHALICEDDVEFQPESVEVFQALLDQADGWDIVRLSGLKEPRGVKVHELPRGYSAKVNFGRLKGAGAYLVNRAAARKFVEKLEPMRLPFDHAIDREWFYGLSAISVSPFLVDQTGTGFRTSIQKGPAQRLSRWWRLRFTYPYQAANELSRWAFRALSLLRTSR